MAASNEHADKLSTNHVLRSSELAVSHEYWTLQPERDLAARRNSLRAMKAPSGWKVQKECGLALTGIQSVIVIIFNTFSF